MIKKYILSLLIIAAAGFAAAADTDNNANITAMREYYKNLYYCKPFGGEIPGVVESTKKSMVITGRKKNLCVTRIRILDENNGKQYFYNCRYPYGIYQKFAYDMLTIITGAESGTGININSFTETQNKYCKYSEK